MSSSDDQVPECPLCMEPLELDDINFFPCTCGYQICRFCWHRIRTDENGLCPACRKQYPEDPADFKPLTAEQLQRIKNEKRQKDLQRKQKISENRKHLANVRVVQKNLVFVVGLPPRLADPEVLKKHDYFGKFGKLHKVVVNHSTSYAGSQGPSASAYVTYLKAEDALKAVHSVNNIHVDGRTLKASLGTTKYCSHFLKNQQCPKQDCMYLHELGDDAASFTKEEMQQGKHQEYERKLSDQILGSCNNTNRRQTSSPTNHANSNPKEVWPTAHSKENRPNGLTKISGQLGNNYKEQRKNRHPSEDDSQKRKHHDRSSEQMSQRNNCRNFTNCHSVNKDGHPPSKSQAQQPRPKGSSEHLIDSSALCFDTTHNSNVGSVNWTASSAGNCVTATEPVKPMVRTNQTVSRSNSVDLQQNRRNLRSQLKPAGSGHDRCDASSPSLSPDPSSSPPQTMGIQLPSNFTPSPPLVSPSPPAMTWGGISGSLDSKLVSPTSMLSSSSSSSSSVPAAGSLSSSYDPLQDSESSLLSRQNNQLHSHGAKNITRNTSTCKDWSNNPNSTQVVTSEAIPANSSTDWQSAFGLGSYHEDELGFDPWDESSRGLADLIEKESCQKPEPKTQHNSVTVLNGPAKSTHYSNHYLPDSTSVPLSKVSAPPPGFAPNHMNHYSGVLRPPFGAEDPGSKIMPLMNAPHRQPVSNGPSYYPEPLPSHINVVNHTKSIPAASVSRHKADIVSSKNWQDSLRALLPNINGSLRSSHTQLPPVSLAQNQKSTVWSCPHSDMLRLSQDAVIISSGTITDSRADSPPHWMKSLHQLTLEDGPAGFNNYHLQYAPPFAYRDPWPAVSQMPPPGFSASIRPAAKPNEPQKITENL